MKITTTLVSIFVSLGLTSVGQALNIAKLDSFCNALSNRDMAMGSLTISKNGVVQYQRAMGYSLMEGNSKLPARIDTKYRIGSVSKTFTAVMIFQLIEERKISLDQKLEYLLSPVAECEYNHDRSIAFAYQRVTRLYKGYKFPGLDGQAQNP